MARYALSPRSDPGHWNGHHHHLGLKARDCPRGHWNRTVDCIRFDFKKICRVFLGLAEAHV